MRLLGHRDGVITAMLAVRRAISMVECTWGYLQPHHTNLLRRKADILAPLKGLETVLEKERASNQDTYNERQAWLTKKS